MLIFDHIIKSMIKKFNELNKSNPNRYEYYLDKMIETHKNKYDYPDLEREFKNSQSKITIHCKSCGEVFKQTISHHIWSKSGCSNCYGNKPNTVEKILRKSKEVHGDGRYSYPNINSEKLSSFSKISITCNKCENNFEQTVASHLLKKNGCNRCSKSKTEQLIDNYLTSNGLKFISQYKFDNCKYIRPLLFDFYIPDHNLCIEYDGEQHYTSRRDDNGERLEIQKIKDKIKNDFCEENKINLERISYLDNLSTKLKLILQKYNLVEIIPLNDVSIKFNKKSSKICSSCKKDKQYIEYNKSTRMLDGYKSQCRECVSKDSRAYYIKNKNKK